MHTAGYPSPSNPHVSLPRLSILGQPPAHPSTPVVARFDQSPAVTAAQVPAFIMVGLDDKGKPHASWFAAHQADAAATAAELMDMGLVEVADDLAAIAATLPQGKLFESGKAFVPFVKRSTYDLLAAHLSDDYLAAAAQRVEAAASADYGKGSKGEAAPRKLFDWRKIAVGDVVLASDGPSEGWYECKVIEAQADSHYLLQWRDWPEVDPFTRYVTDIGLLHPDLATEAPE